MLVKGLERLHQGYQRELWSKADTPNRRNPWQLDKLKQFINNAYQESRDGDRFLAQNPYVELFRFREAHLSDGQDGSRLSGMLLLYHQLQILEELSVDQLSDAYEILCNSIRSIQGADMCYMVSRRLTDTRMFCTSSVKKDGLDTQLSSREAGELLDRLGEKGKFQEITEGIFLEKGLRSTGGKVLPDKDWRVGEFLILPILLYDKQGAPREEQAYLICQRRGGPTWSKNEEDTLLRVRDTLFLRGQLAQALARDLASLLSAGREYRDIGRRSGEGEPLKLFHISDLHVTEQNCEVLKKAIPELKLEDGPFDFLVITGDVAQGRAAAGDLERHYDCAAEIIRALAFHMWSEAEGGEQVLRQDWKRRTIVIPGNHDYASMNELETQHGENHRASAGGRPAAQEGSAMAKFTYYINFVRKLLDVEVGELIDNDLNELRRYDMMGVDFLCFNTSVMANPARNNKVHLDQSFAQRTIRRLSPELGQRFTIFLGHHGPDYRVDYVSDEYLERYICRDITEKYAEAAQTSSDEDRKKALEALKLSLEALNEKGEKKDLDNEFVQVWLLENEETQLPANIEDKVVRRRKKTRLYRELTFLLEQLNRDKAERSINERYQRIIAELNRTKLLSENDQQAYAEVFHRLDSLHLAVCLSGHTHEWDIRPEERRYVAKRFQWEQVVQKVERGELERKTSLHYGVCKLRRDSAGPKVEYQMRDEDI